MSATKTEYKCFIGGEWSDAASGETMEVINPATGQVIAEVPKCGAEDVDRAVAAAKTTLETWLDVTPKERSELLHKLADVLDDNVEELAQLESLNVGKPLMASRDEIPFCADNLRFFAGAARNLEGKSAGEYIAGYTSIIRREPLGIVAGICPWNYPLMMAIWKLGPRARRRQRPDPQAVGADAAVAAALRAARAGRDPGRRAQRRHGRRRARGRADRRASGRAARVAHRRRLDGQGDREERGRHAQARPPRARRQGADGRLRRRRPEGGRRGHPARRLLELRPGLHRRARG